MTCIAWEFRLSIFLGGEPLLYFDSLIKLLNYCNEKFYLGFASNGVGNGGFTKERCNLLKQIKNIDIRISLQSSVSWVHNEVVGVENAFDSAVASIQNLVEAGNRCTWSCMPMRCNKGQIIEMARQAHEWGMSGFHMLNPHPTDMFSPGHEQWLDQNERMELIAGLETLMASLGDPFSITYSNWYCRLAKANTASKMCGAMQEIVEIDDQGDCYPCSIVLGNPSFKMGNAFKESIQLIYSMVDPEKLLGLSLDALRGTKCGKCDDLRICQGGCPLANYKIHGDVNKPDIECPR